MASKRQIQANRKNGRKGGVKTPQGKAISRLNARKHGIFASALTPEDAEELHGINDQLAAEIQPVGLVEEMLVEKLALTYLQLQRCARAEAEYHIRVWEEPDMVYSLYEWERLDKKRARGVRAVPFRQPEFARMVERIGLYDMRLTNQYLKLLHEIERLQRLRAGEKVSPPVVADLTLQVDTVSTVDAAVESAVHESQNAAVVEAGDVDEEGEPA